MSATALTQEIIAEIEAMVSVYSPRRADFAILARKVATDLIEHQELRPHIHSWKQREKDPTHLRDKLHRKAAEATAAGKAFSLTKDNIFAKMGDLAGVRLLHIHTEQLTQIHPVLLRIFKYYSYRFREKPLVYIWDVEREEYFKRLGLKVIVRTDMYTSVHYVVEPHYCKDACEIQVRTLAEELWGEVSHKINYPHKTKSVACTEQLAALARVASGCTRLVDSIFASDSEHKTNSKKKEAEVTVGEKKATVAPG